MQAAPLQTLVLDAAKQRDRRAEAVLRVNAGHPGERLANDQAHRFGIEVLAGIAPRRQMLADIAATAAREGFLFIAEIAKHGVVSATAPLGEPHEFEKEAPFMLHGFGARGGARVIAFDQESSTRHVARGKKQQPDGVLAIAPGAAHFLVIGFHRARGRQVDHRADVGAIDAHPKGVGGHHHLEVPATEGPVGLFPGPGVQARVVDARLPSPGLQARPLLLGGAPGGGIDDGGTAPAAG